MKTRYLLGIVVMLASCFSLFLQPVMATTAPGLSINRAGVIRTGTNLTFQWTGGTGPYLLQKRVTATDFGWATTAVLITNSTTVAVDGRAAFFRIADADTSAADFTVVLNGANERPNPTNTRGVGSGMLRLEGNTLTYTITYSALSGPATAAHIHGRASSSETAVPLFNLTPLGGTSGTLSGVVTLTPQQRAMLLEGKTYANIHTAANGGGEIRGQVILSKFKAALSGPGERPNPVNTSASGSALFTLIGNQLAYQVTYSGLSGPATAAHVHGPSPENGTASPMFNLTPVGAFAASGVLAGTATLTDAQLNAFADGLVYANVHTAANPGGEIRGQVTPLILEMPFSVEMSGGLERPNLVNTTAKGIGNLILDGNTLLHRIEYSGLSSNATAAHIHAAATSEGTASPIFNLDPAGKLAVAGSLAGAVALTPEQRGMILSGMSYANIHTGANPGGEIRGAIIPTLLSVSMTGGGERPIPVATTATAGGLVSVLGNQLIYGIDYTGLSGPATAAHIHGPAGATESAAPIISLSPAGAFAAIGTLNGSTKLTDPQLAAIADRKTYANIHTAGNPSGEIRGHLIAALPGVALNTFLNGAAERPNPITSPAIGIGALRLDGNTLIYHISYTGLSGAATAAHIHGPAPVDGTAAPLFNLVPMGVFGTSGVLAGSVILTPDQRNAILGGLTYANIHTAANPNGEIRGHVGRSQQIVVLNGASEKPNSVNTTAMALAALTLLGNQLSYQVSYTGLSGTATAAHIHGPALATETASPLFNLTPLGTFAATGALSGTVTLTDAQIAAYLAGKTYVNIHTAANPAGEIRGQIAP